MARTSPATPAVRTPPQLLVTGARMQASVGEPVAAGVPQIRAQQAPSTMGVAYYAWVEWLIMNAVVEEVVPRERAAAQDSR
jgi:hypothetical protein